MSKIQQANLLLSSLEIDDINNHLETAIKVIEKYGSLQNNARSFKNRV